MVTFDDTTARTIGTMRDRGAPEGRRVRRDPSLHCWRRALLTVPGRWRDDLLGLGQDYFFSLNRYLFLAIK